MRERIERATALTFPLIVVLVAAHVLGVPLARSAALVAILLGAAGLGLERLFGERRALDVAAGVLLPAGAVVGAVVGVVEHGGTDPLLVFGPAVPGLITLYAAEREIPGVAILGGWLSS